MVLRVFMGLTLLSLWINSCGMTLLKDKNRAVLRHHFSQTDSTVAGTAKACGVDVAFVEHVLAENSSPSLYKEPEPEPSKPEKVMAYYRTNPSASIQEIEDATGVHRHYAFKILAKRGF